MRVAGLFSKYVTVLAANRLQYPQVSWRTGRRFRAWRWSRQVGMKWSMKAMKRALCVGSRRWTISCVTMYSRHSRGLRARSVLRRMPAVAALQLPHLVFIEDAQFTHVIENMRTGAAHLLCGLHRVLADRNPGKITLDR